jgi:hypothetical protein
VCVWGVFLLCSLVGQQQRARGRATALTLTGSFVVGVAFRGRVQERAAVQRSSARLWPHARRAAAAAVRRARCWASPGLA